MKIHWTIREEANALTCCAFRNGPIEDLHAGIHSELLDDPNLSRITDAEMEKIMINASEKLAELLAMKESDPEKYWRTIEYFNECAVRWEKKPSFGFTTREKPTDRHVESDDTKKAP